MRLRATTKLRNDVLISAREREGLNQREFGKRCGLRVDTVCALEKMDFTRADLRHAQAAADYLCCDVSAIMPPELVGVAVPSMAVQVREVSSHLLACQPSERLLLPSPASIVDAGEIREKVRAAIAGIPKRQCRVTMKMHLRGWTLQRMGRWLHVTRERVRQIVNKGERILMREFTLKWPELIPSLGRPLSAGEVATP